MNKLFVDALNDELQATSSGPPKSTAHMLAQRLIYLASTAGGMEAMKLIAHAAVKEDVKEEAWVME